MGSAGTTLFNFDNTFVRDLPGLYEPWQAAPASAPRLLAFNTDLAAELGVDADALQGPKGVAVLVGNAIADGASPVAQAYAGHQFGSYSPRLGDGRALLLGEILDASGHRRDLSLKGSGRTPFARGGDGRAAVGPMLREYLISEAMHALAIPTTRSLAVTATGDEITRETMLPGAVLARVAASHIRVGTFEYAARSADVTLTRRLADYSVARHYPDALGTANPYLAFLENVVEVQASLVAQWMLVGFIHGVMNTDNTTISGETIDYGPCAFMEGFDLATVFSSIDHGGRYAYGNQSQIVLWNLARLAETLLPLIDEVPEAAVEKATEVLESFDGRYSTHWSGGMHNKLGLVGEQSGDAELIDDFLVLLRDQHIDFTSGFRALSTSVRDHTAPGGSVFGDASAFEAWSTRHLARLAGADHNAVDAAAAMDRVNPIYIPRNQLVEEALTAANDGDLAPFEQLLDVISRPFDERPGLERFATPAPSSFAGYQTFCGT